VQSFPPVSASIAEKKVWNQALILSQGLTRAQVLVKVPVRIQIQVLVDESPGEALVAATARTAAAEA
jgi:hypothetical protein